jgi:type VI secretion system secreted protein VgrG
VTNTGASVVTGNLAVFPIASVTGFPPGTISGTTQLATAAAMQAHVDSTMAYNYLKSLTPTKDLTGIDLAGETLTPGVYNFDSTGGISAAGTLTLSGAGVYVFQVGSAITTGANTFVSLANGANTIIALKNGAKAGCIFWQVGSSVTLGASSTFLGNILAYASVTFGADVTYKGSVFAQTGDVTLIDDIIAHQASCSC